VPDCLRAAVKYAPKYEPAINPEYVKVVVEQALAPCQHPEQGDKTCLGILSLAKQPCKNETRWQNFSRNQWQVSTGTGGNFHRNAWQV